MVCTYEKNEKLDFLYKTLTELGYEMSDEEKALQDGTHELFREYEEGPDPCAFCKAAHPFCNRCCKACDDHCNGVQVCRKEGGED